MTRDKSGNRDAQLLLSSKLCGIQTSRCKTPLKMASSLRISSSQLLPRSCRPLATSSTLRSSLRAAARNIATTTSSTSTANTPRRSRWTRRMLWGSVFAGLGYYTGQQYLRSFTSPAAPGTAEDAQRMEELRRLVDYVPIVQKLRKDPKYVEWDAYESFSDEDKEKILSSGPLKGSRGLALQVCFTIATIYWR